MVNPPEQENVGTDAATAVDASVRMNEDAVVKPDETFVDYAQVAKPTNESTASTVKKNDGALYSCCCGRYDEFYNRKYFFFLIKVEISVVASALGD